MNAASLCNSVLLHSHSLSRFRPSSSYLISPRLTSSTFISISHRIRQSFRAVVVKRNDRFRSFAVNKRRSESMESESSIDDDGDEDDEDEDWSDLDVEAEGDEDEGEFLPMDKMKKWLEKKPRGFGVGKKYETSIEDKLLDEIEQSWKAQAANLNKLKNDPLKPHLKRDDNQTKGLGETQHGFLVRVTNLPKKKNVHRDLKVAFKEVSGILNIAPAVSGNKKTKDPVCKGFALVDFKSEIDANRFVEEFTGQRLSFGKVIKQIKCQVVDFSSNQTESEEENSNKGFEEQELRFSGLLADSNADDAEEDALLDSGEGSDNSESDEDVDETEVEEDEQNRISSIIESPIELRRDPKSKLKPQKHVVKLEIREHEESETGLVTFQANKSEEAVAETLLDDELNTDVENVAEENPKPLNNVLSSDEQRIDRIRKLELKLLGREKLLGGGADSDQPGKVDGKKEKKKKKKILVKGQAKKSSKIEIPGASKRLKVKEKALLTGVLEKYAAKAASTSNGE